jgi:immunoglobulin-binding protein 1
MADQRLHQINKPNETVSLTQMLHKAETLLSAGSFEDTIVGLAMLEKLQEKIHADAVFSANECLDDVSTSSLPLLNTEYLLGKAYLQLPTSSSIDRRVHVLKAMDSYHSFLRRCDVLEGILNDEVAKEYHDLLEMDDMNQNEGDDNGTGHVSSISKVSPTFTRDKKIARFRLTKSFNTQKETILALKGRRSRLGLAEGEDLEGYDAEGLDRALHLSELNIHSCESIEEIYSCTKEMDILPMAIQMEESRKIMAQHKDANGNHLSDSAYTGRSHPQQNLHRKPLEVTRVTTDPMTRQLVMKREQVRSTVFRPDWNQPTMSLDDFAQLEIADALARSERQSELENTEDILRPKRYEQLVKEGKEDDPTLVELSTDVDRRWDDWKDEHPKGSGNKMGDRGDRNF